MTRSSQEPRDGLDRTLRRLLRNPKLVLPVPSALPGDPSDDDLLRVLDGSADTEVREHVEARAQRSPFVRAQLEVLRSVLAELESAPEALMRAARYVFRVGQDALAFLRGPSVPVAAAVEARSATRSGNRAPEDTFHELEEQRGELMIRLRIEHVAATRLDVQVALEEKGVPVSDARVSLKKGSRVVDSLPVESSGTATLTGLVPAAYQLEVVRPGHAPERVALEFLKN